MSAERLAYLDALTERVREMQRDLRELRAQSTAPSLRACELRGPDGLAAAWNGLRTAWVERAERRPLSEEPLISIAIAAGSDESCLLGTLHSIATTWFESLPVEIVVAAESEVQAARIREHAPGTVALVRDPVAPDSRTAAVAVARGAYLFLLDEGVALTNGCLDRLVTLLESERSIGIAAARLLAANGSPDDGSIATADGELVPSPVLTGRVGDLHDVDVAPAGATLVRRDLFRTLGGLDPRFVSPRYRLASLCLAARAVGMRVVVNVAATAVADVTHDVDRAQLALIHRALLAPRSRDPERASVAAARGARSGEVVLAIVPRLPIGGWAREQRTFGMLRAWRERGYYVALLPDDGVLREPAAAEIAALGVELLCGARAASGRDAVLAGILPILAVAWLYGEDVLDRYAERMRLNRAVRVIYDADVRTYGRARVLDLASRADVVACARKDDVSLLAEQGVEASLVDAGNAADALRAVCANLQ